MARMTKTKYGDAQKFPEAFAEKWQQVFQDGGYCKLVEPILVPKGSVSSQLKAVKEVGSVLEGEKDYALLIRMLVEVHSSCISRHPLQRAINSMLLSLSDENQKLAAVQSISTNLFNLLQDPPVCCDDHKERLTQDSINARIQYVESLLENFTLGEMALSLQLPLALDYCSKMIHHCSSLQKNCSNIGVFVDVLKITMNMIQRFSVGFFSVMADSNSWPVQQAPMSPKDKTRSTKNKLSKINQICEKLLLRDDLQHDVTLSAAMLTITVSNIINSSSEQPLLGYAELVKSYLSLDGLNRFSSLALCYAFLAKTATSMMVGVRLDNDEPLVLSLFPRVCHLFDGFTETSDRYIASRTLALWSTVAKDCVHTKDELVSQALSPSGVIIHKLLQYIWSLWEDPIDGIRLQCKEIFENIICVYQQLGSDESESESLLGLAKQLLSLESPTRGKFVLLSSLVRHLSVGKLVRVFPALPADLLSVMGHQSLACHAGDLWSKLVNLHWLEVKGNVKNETTWNNIWVLSVLKAMCSSNPPACRRHITQHCLPSLFHSNDTCMKYVNQQLETITSSKDYRMAAQLACLRCAKMECKSSNEYVDNLDVIFRTSMYHSDEEINLSGLCLVCESHRATDPPVPSQLTLLLGFLKINGNNQAAGFKEPLLTCLKKILNRIKDSSYAMLKLHQKGRGSDPQALIQSYQKFLGDLLDQQFELVHPLSSFQRRNLSLSILQLLASCFQSPLNHPSYCGTDATSSVVFEFPTTVSRSQASYLLDGLQDEYDTNRILCLDLLLKLPADKLGFSEMGFVGQCTAEYLTLVAKPKSVSCASAACMLKFLTAAACAGFNLHLAHLLNVGEESSEVVEVTDSLELPSVRTLDLLCFLLRRHISVAKSDLVVASMTAPMYGAVQSIRAIIEGKLTDVEFIESLLCRNGSVVRKIIDICKELSDVVSPVVCSSSPEGFFPDTGHQGGVAALPSSDGGDSSEGNAQSLLLCCWHTMKEVSLLLGYIVGHLHVVSNPKECFLRLDQMCTISDIYIHQLTEARHRGAFEMAYTGFSKLCHTLWTSSIHEMNQMPKLWVKELLDSLQSSSIAKLLTVTRRSAGLPFYMQAILTSEPSLTGRTCLKSAMEVLLKVAHDSVSDPPAATCSQISADSSGVSGVVKSQQPAAVHALNILRALYRDSRLGEHVVSFIPQGVIVAINGFAANLWPVRNSSNLLFTALVLRIFGAKRVQDEHSIKNKITAREFFTRFPSLYGYLLKELAQSTGRLMADRNTGSLQPSLLPLLLILSRLYPSPLDEANSPISLNPFIPLLISCTCCSVWKTRVLVARTLSLMLTHQNWMDVVSKIYMGMSLSDQNNLHGLLLVMSRIIEDKRTLMSYSSDGGKPVSVLILEFHLQKMWAGLRINDCPVTRSLYLEILNNLLEYRSSSNDLNESISLQVSKFTSLSLDICATLKPAPQDDPIFHDLVLLQNVRLLEVYLRGLYLCPLDATPTAHSIRRALVNVFRHSSSTVVCVRALKCIEETDVNCVIEVVVGIITQDSQPKLLVEAYNFISKARMKLDGHQLEMVVSTAYHALLQSSNRIELRVSLIQFLCTSLVHLGNPLQYLGGLLESFEKLIVPTQPLEIRLAISTGVLKLWGLSLGDANGERWETTTQCCRVVVAILQDTSGEVRVTIAKAVAEILRDGTSNFDVLESLNPPAALKFFVVSLPYLIPNANVSFETLVSLLPENTLEVHAPTNPLFNEDPLNDYAEELVLMEYVVRGLEIVVPKLQDNRDTKHYKSLVKHVSQKRCEESVWKNPHGYLNQIKANMLSPLLVALRK